jgi:hypothetical protein
MAGELVATQRVALLREGIVVLEADGAPLRLVVAGAGEDRVHEVVRRLLGDTVVVDVFGHLPRRLETRRCVGHMEREPGRLQLRLEFRSDEHVDEIVVAEDESFVVVLATVCTSVSGDPTPEYEGPAHVYLKQPLGGRAVIDGTTGEAVPYKNVYATLGQVG